MCIYINTEYWPDHSFNRKKLLRKARDRFHNGGGKKNASKYYVKNREASSEKARNRYRNLPEKEKEAKREYQRERYHYDTGSNEKLKQYQKDYYDSKRIRK